MTDRVPQGTIHERECEVTECDTWVRYVDYVPHVYLCRDCGFPDPAPVIEADENGVAVIRGERA